ncbi:MAG: hypothetical protein LBS82_01035 [Spirochaetaceae bacterium]|jgi:uncharacterized DUF497 family protein|nr:hypothetical protein [Spirochaetaceae bacterium]
MKILWDSDKNKKLMVERGLSFDEFEQSIEDGADSFIPVSGAEQDEIESIIATVNKTRNAAIRLSMRVS